MNKWIGKILVTILGLVLMVYTGTRIVDFVGLTLPDDKKILAYFALAATELGAVVWLLAFKYGSEGGAQRGISLVMILVDVIGIISLFTADTLYNTGATDMTIKLSQQEMFTFILVLTAVIGLNVISFIAHHILDPQGMREMKEDEASTEVENQANDAVGKASKQLGAELAPQIAQARMDALRAKYTHANDLTKHIQPAKKPMMFLPKISDVPPEQLEPEQEELARLEAEYNSKTKSNGNSIVKALYTASEQEELARLDAEYNSKTKSNGGMEKMNKTAPFFLGVAPQQDEEQPKA